MNKKILKVAAKFERLLIKKAQLIDDMGDAQWPKLPKPGQPTPLTPGPGTTKTHNTRFNFPGGGTLSAEEEVYGDGQQKSQKSQFGSMPGETYKPSDNVDSKFPLQTLVTFVNRIKLYVDQDNLDKIYDEDFKSAFYNFKNTLYNAAQRENSKTTMNTQYLNTVKSKLLSLYKELYNETIYLPNVPEKNVMIGNMFEIKKILDGINPTMYQAQEQKETTPKNIKPNAGFAKPQDIYHEDETLNLTTKQPPAYRDLEKNIKPTK